MIYQNEMVITPKEFIDFENLYSRTLKNEWIFSIDPIFRKYQCNISSFISQKVFPIIRIDKYGKLTSKYEDREASSIKFSELSKNFHLYSILTNEGYYNKGSDILSYHCSTCNIFVIKDGNHRLIKWIADKKEEMLNIYQVSSHDWSKAKTDMPNYCECIKKTN